jgi:hypothetical protein
MDQNQFEAADRHVDDIAELLDRALRSAELGKLREALAALGEGLGEGFSVTLSCVVEVFDRGRERTLPLLNTGLSTSGGAGPHRVWGDSTPQRYVVGGQIRVVPHDRCPECWGAWDFKWRHRQCPHCDAELGKNCKVLLDSDVCPHCEEGRVTAGEPRCDRCGFVVEPALVVWG